MEQLEGDITHPSFLWEEWGSGVLLDIRKGSIGLTIEQVRLE